MKVVIATLLISVLALSAAQAQQPNAAAPPDSPPTAESIHRLLDVMDARNIVDAMDKEMDAYFTNILKQVLDGKPVSEKQQKAIEKARQDVHDLMQANLSWPSMESLYVEVYAKTFTQADVDTMITFYSSPTGHAVVQKVPLVMKNTMSIMQQRMQQILPKIQQMATDAVKDPDSPQVQPNEKSG